MTFEKMKDIIIKNAPFGELVKNSGICEFYEDSNIGVGVSLEDDGYENECYIYNLFAGGEYININGFARKVELITELIINELVEKWNKYYK